MTSLNIIQLTLLIQNISSIKYEENRWYNDATCLMSVPGSDLMPLGAVRSASCLISLPEGIAELEEIAAADAKVDNGSVHKKGKTLL